MQREIWIIYLIINLFAFILMGYDKRMAIARGWRIPEKVLLGLSAMGGAAGGMLAMRMWRHKTLKLKFRAGLPLMFIAHVFVFFKYLQ